ncbi:MAG TPA: hypothetical protein VFU46_01920 [Gemmatimonadales bacterium]|nr:hypothetical protein [Gemmatimonadales bacterium]
MSRRSRSAAAGLALSCLASTAASAQGYRLRLDTRFQTVVFRGVTPDSIPAGSAVIGASGGLETPDGFAVVCAPGSDVCTFFRPGPRLASNPLVSSADLTVWGLGVRGLSVRGNARWGVDLGSDDLWPGTQPALQLLEGYAEYSTPRVTGRLGRQHVYGRFGWTGVDGAALTVRSPRLGLELTGYGGWGLARSLDVPMTSPSLNPLDDFQLPERHVTVGAALGWRSRWADIRAEYRREVDPSVDFFISERTALTAVLRPTEHLTLTGGTEYDLAQGWWGSSDLFLRYGDARVNADAGVRRYRPYFELWTIWGAFSPVPYTAIDGSFAFAPIPPIRLRVSGERYWFNDSGAETALATYEDRGWRTSLSATALVSRTLTLDGGYHAEFGPGAASRTWDGRVTWLPAPSLTLSAFGSTFTRPLELRFDEAQVNAVGIDAAVRASDRLQLALTGAQYFEDRRRPDAGAFDWNQFRLQARITWVFGSDADRLRLPPAIRGAGRRVAR